MVNCTLDRQLAANEVQFPIIKYILVIVRFNLVPDPKIVTMVASKSYVTMRQSISAGLKSSQPSRGPNIKKKNCCAATNHGWSLMTHYRMQPVARSDRELLTIVGK